MGYPRLKNALLCRILVYVVVLGGFGAPVAVVANLSFIPNEVKVFVGFASVIGFLVYCFRNFTVLFAMDMLLATLHCHNTARKRFTLSPSFSVQKLERRVSRFGERCDPVMCSPHAKTVRYKSKFPWTIYSSGIEKVIVAYDVDFLDKSQYDRIFHSAMANSTAQRGKKKQRFLDKAQKKSPLNRVTVIIIYAKQVEEKFEKDLFDVVCKNAGDGFDIAILPCVIDLEKRVCTFDSERIPYTGFQYPVKNRGIKIIRKYIFSNKFPFSQSADMLDPIKDLNPEQSLWNLWRKMKNDIVLEDRKLKKRFERMEHRELVMEDGYLYLKWQNRGIWLSVDFNEELRIAEIDAIRSWDYPKSNAIAKDTAKEMMGLINTYCARLGYTTKYISE